MTWRDIAASVVKDCIQKAKQQGLDEKTTRQLISKAYPFGQRAYSPYKIWLSEVKKQMPDLHNHAKQLEMNIGHGG